MPKHIAPNPDLIAEMMLHVEAYGISTALDAITRVVKTRRDVPQIDDRNVKRLDSIYEKLRDIKDLAASFEL